MKIHKILSVSSFAIHGSASLKLLLSKYGKYVLPVPSALFTDLTNNPLHQKFELPFRDLLESTLQIIAHNNQKIVFHVGYLSSAAQVEILLEKYTKYQSNIHALVVDPVMGDHGKWYVSPELLPAWKALLKEADFTTPNFTELKLLCGMEADELVDMDILLPLFKVQFPKCNLICTSVPGDEKQKIVSMENNFVLELNYPKHPQELGGTGDLFTASFIVHYYIKNYPLKIAIDNSHKLVSKAIGKALKKNRVEMF